MMSRYEPLADYLDAMKTDHWDASFADIEAKLGCPLPASAYRYAAWWANQSGSGHSQTRGWRSVGWRTTALDLEHRKVKFERERGTGRSAASINERSGDETLFARAREITGIDNRRALVNEALSALIAREAGARLSRLGGSMPDYTAPARERPER